MQMQAGSKGPVNIQVLHLLFLLRTTELTIQAALKWCRTCKFQCVRLSSIQGTSSFDDQNAATKECADCLVGWHRGHRLTWTQWMVSCGNEPTEDNHLTPQFFSAPRSILGSLSSFFWILVKPVGFLLWHVNIRAFKKVYKNHNCSWLRRSVPHKCNAQKGHQIIHADCYWRAIPTCHFSSFSAVLPLKQSFLRTHPSKLGGR